MSSPTISLALGPPGSMALVRRLAALPPAVRALRTSAVLGSNPLKDSFPIQRIRLGEKRAMEETEESKRVGGGSNPEVALVERFAKLSPSRVFDRVVYSSRSSQL